MKNGHKGNTVGIMDLIGLFTSWMAVWAAPYILAPRWVPHLWLVTIAIVLPCATVSGVLAARNSSRWWYVLAGASLLSAVLLIAATAA